MLQKMNKRNITHIVYRDRKCYRKKLNKRNIIHIVYRDRKCYRHKPVRKKPYGFCGLDIKRYVSLLTESPTNMLLPF